MIDFQEDNYHEYIELNSNVVNEKLYQDKAAFITLLQILFDVNRETNSVKTSLHTLSGELYADTETIKKALSRLQNEGVIELYKTSRREMFIIAVRKDERFFRISGGELHLDESLIFSFDRRRNIPGYSKFRKDVLTRDGYKCQICGCLSDLEVHHKKKYSEYPKLRTSVSNGITVCKDCHKAIHRKKV